MRSNTYFIGVCSCIKICVIMVIVFLGSGCATEIKTHSNVWEEPISRIRNIIVTTDMQLASFKMKGFSMHLLADLTMYLEREHVHVKPAAQLANINDKLDNKILEENSYLLNVSLNEVYPSCLSCEFVRASFILTLHSADTITHYYTASFQMNPEHKWNDTRTTKELARAIVRRLKIDGII